MSKTNSLPSLLISATDFGGKKTFECGIHWLLVGRDRKVVVISPAIGPIAPLVPITIEYAAGKESEGYAGFIMREIALSYLNVKAAACKKKLPPFEFFAGNTVVLDKHGVESGWTKDRMQCPCCGRFESVRMPGDRKGRRISLFRDEPHCLKCKGPLRFLPKRSLMEIGNV